MRNCCGMVPSNVVLGPTGGELEMEEDGNARMIPKVGGGVTLGLEGDRELGSVSEGINA